MKKYSFRLQTVLEIREKKLDDKRREMASVVKTLNEQIDEKNMLVSRNAEITNCLEKIYTGGQELNIMEITNYKNFMGKVTNAIKIQEGVIKNTENILKVKQMEVSDALKELKVLEKLKEKQEKKFYEHYNYLEMKELDDIASTRYKREAIA